jgi:Helix-turn-helix domain
MKTKATPKAASPTVTPKAAAKKRKSWPAFTDRFGDTVRQAGVTAVPRVLLTSLGALKVTPIQGMILLQLIACWGRNGKHPFPGRRRLREWLGCDKRTLDRAITGLVDLGLVDRRRRVGGEYRRQTTNEYDLSGLVDRLKPLARKTLNDKKQRLQRQQAGEGT